MVTQTFVMKIERIQLALLLATALSCGCSSHPDFSDVHLLCSATAEELPEQSRSLLDLNPYQVSMSQAKLAALLKQASVPMPEETHILLGVAHRQLTGMSLDECCDHHTWVEFERAQGESNTVYVYAFPRELKNGFGP